MTGDERLKKQDVFIKWLSRKGNVSAACKKAKIDRSTAYEWRKDDPNFAKRWEEAIEIATEWMEEEARRRAADGVLQPVFQGGKRVGSIRKYSDTLLIFLLKAHKPEKYRDNYHIEHAGTLTHEHAISASNEIMGRINSIASRVEADADDQPDSTNGER